ncbi:G-protein coupled receptor 15-like [Scyliorhinus torazame]|uniref:G-protein coupled receptor 15-like n=1 Tax=Scyliorhinus torazame TaxID=75743 RepID=UPI003B58BE09
MQNPCSATFILISLISPTVNLVTIVILFRGKCGHSSCTSRYLVAMAMAHLLLIITEVKRWQISSYYFPGSFLEITPVCSFTFVLLYAAADCSVWFTITFTFDRFVAICCHKLKTKYCTGKTAALVLSAICILLCLKDIPVYFRFEPAVIINNVSWFCKEKPSYYTDTTWIGFNWFDTVLTSFLPYALILLFSALTVKYIFVTSRVRKSLGGQSKGQYRSNPEMESRRKSIILLFAISSSFILLWLPNVTKKLYYIIEGIRPVYYNDSSYIFTNVGVMLAELSCCTNPFIYWVTQSRFREQVKSAVKYPVTSIIQLINKVKN